MHHLCNIVSFFITFDPHLIAISCKTLAGVSGYCEVPRPDSVCRSLLLGANRARGISSSLGLGDNLLFEADRPSGASSPIQQGDIELYLKLLNQVINFSS